MWPGCPSGAGREAAVLAALGRFVFLRRFLVAGLWLVVAVAGGVVGGSVYDRTQTIDPLPADAPAAVAQARLDAVSPEGERLVAVISGRDTGSTELIDSVTQTAYQIRDMPGVAGVDDAYT